MPTAKARTRTAYRHKPFSHSSGNAVAKPERGINSAEGNKAIPKSSDRGPANSRSGGPRTAEGKAISARNSTTHGLFCRQTVLPHLGEDPKGYQDILNSLYQQFDPRTLMERQYLELWADASWKLRRLSRFEAQIWENDSLDEDLRLFKLERLMRLQNMMRRQLDKAVRMLTKDVPDAQERYARRAILAARHATEADCRVDAELAYRVASEVQADILCGSSMADCDQSRLDNAPDTDTAETIEKCQNEPAYAETIKKCENELHSNPVPPRQPTPFLDLPTANWKEKCQNELHHPPPALHAVPQTASH